MRARSAPKCCHMCGSGTGAGSRMPMNNLSALIRANLRPSIAAGCRHSQLFRLWTVENSAPISLTPHFRYRVKRTQSHTNVHLITSPHQRTREPRRREKDSPHQTHFSPCKSALSSVRALNISKCHEVFPFPSARARARGGGREKRWSSALSLRCSFIDNKRN